MSITIVQKNKSKGILTWYARVPDPRKRGVPHYFSLNTTSKSEAKIRKEERLKAGDFDLKNEAETMTLGEAAVKFEQYERAKGTKPRSIETMLQALNMLKGLSGKTISDITNKEISETFLESGESLSPITYRNRKAILSTFFNYLVDVLEILPHNPIRKAIPRRKIPKKKRDFWTADQIDRIIANAPNPRARLLWSFMAFAGLRVSEAKAMQPESIHDGYIHVKGKGDKEAKIPICPRLQREIDRYDGEWKFSFAEETLRKVAAKAIPEGFPGKAHAHRFRHSFGSNLIRAGVNIKIVQTLMRHESINLTLDTYGHILDTDCEKAIRDVYK